MTPAPEPALRTRKLSTAGRGPAAAALAGVRGGRVGRSPRRARLPSNRRVTREPLAAGAVLGLAVVAASAWWAFTTRRVWKRQLNLVVAALVVANLLLGLLM